MRVVARTAALVLAASIVVALAGCSAPEQRPSEDGQLRVVASTNVYGSLAEAIGGDEAQVTSVIADPSQDPHSYEGNVRVQLALSRADIVIENGGGYDDFVDVLLAGVDNPGARVINAVKLSTLDAGERFNEHVWYDFPTIAAVIGEIREAFVATDPEHADLFIRNAGDLVRGLSELKSREAETKAKFAGLAVAVTEPVPLYLLAACGLENKTPSEFSAAIESGAGVTPAVMREMLDEITTRTVKLLVYNSQTAGPETERLLAEAKTAGIPTLAVTETIPDGQGYLGWMGDILDRLDKALGGQA